jgi:hypothetical protein
MNRLYSEVMLPPSARVALRIGQVRAISVEDVCMGEFASDVAL